MNPMKAEVTSPGAGTETAIYVVDNEPGVLDLVRLALSQGPWEVRAFPDAASALNRFAEATPKPALLLTDYAMEPMSGLELGQRCRALHPPLKVIFMSGGTRAEACHGAAFPLDAFLPKPFRLQQLTEVVQSVLSGGLS
jgi:two-component system, cell cycle sensor histidine kinase and response regulator CckA